MSIPVDHVSHEINLQLHLVQEDVQSPRALMVVKLQIHQLAGHTCVGKLHFVSRTFMMDYFVCS